MLKYSDLVCKIKDKSKGALMKKYVQIFHDLEEKILKKTYKPGDYLPTELELTKTYAVSRDTIRKALKLLDEAGLIQKMQGRGSQVIKREQINFPVSELTSYQELVDSIGLKSQTKVISLDKVIVDEDLSKKTGFAPNSLVWRVIRLRIVDGVAAVLDTDYLCKNHVPHLSKDIAQKSIYNYLENDLKLDIAYAEKEIIIDHTNAKDKTYLDLGADQHVVSVTSKVYLANTKQFQFTDSRHKLEKFKFVDFARRKK